MRNIKAQAQTKTLTYILITVLCILMGLALLYYFWKLKGRLLP